MEDLKVVFSYLRPHRREMAAAVVLLLLECVFEMAIPLIMTDIVDVGVPAHDIPYLLRQGGWMVLCALLALLTGLAYARFAARAAYGFGAQLRLAEYRRLQSYAFSNLDRFSAPSLVTRMTTDVTVMQNVINAGLRPLVRSPVMLVLGIGLAFFLNRKLALVFVIASPILGGILFLIVGKVGPLYHRQQRAVDHLNGRVQEALTAIRAIKARYPDFYVITDVCMCEYTDHGHCGILDGHEVDNDKTLEVLAKTALSHAQAGADMVAPSDMMDGRVAAIRAALDGHGFQNVPILAYSAKYASAFYGPFRSAAGSAPSFGDRKGYQMDPHNRKEAIKECELDIAEGADLIMVKPALSYLDVIRECADTFDLPLCAYSVSGEYAMIKAAAAAGLINEYRIMCESALSVFRAGANMLITYYAKELAQAIRKGDIG